MRLAKKFGAVVAMAAVCLTMVVPTTASAACFHYYKVYDTNQIILKDSHNCPAGVTENMDGSVEVIYERCNIVTTETYRSKKCEKCGDTIINEHQSTVTTHSHPLCPYNN